MSSGAPLSHATARLEAFWKENSATRAPIPFCLKAILQRQVAWVFAAWISEDLRLKRQNQKMIRDFRHNDSNIFLSERDTASLNLFRLFYNGCWVVFFQIWMFPSALFSALTQQCSVFRSKHSFLSSQGQRKSHVILLSGFRITPITPRLYMIQRACHVRYLEVSGNLRSIERTVLADRPWDRF